MASQPITGALAGFPAQFLAELGELRDKRIGEFRRELRVRRVIENLHEPRFTRSANDQVALRGADEGFLVRLTHKFGADKRPSHFAGKRAPTAGRTLCL